MNYKIRPLAAAGLLAAAVVATGAFAGDDSGVLSAGKLAKDAKKYYGQTVAVKAEVEDVLSANAFTLDEDAIFYLRARGLNYAEARDMLIHAFAGQVLEGVKVQPLRDALEAEMFEQLAKDLAEVDAARK